MEQRLLELLNKVFENKKEDEKTLSEEEKRKMKSEQKELIHIASALYPHLNLDFGNEENGNMNKKNLRILYQKLQNLKKLYKTVFTYDGEVFACGRDKCRELIKAASELYPQENFGDEEKGMMNSWNLLAQRSIIFVEYKDAF